MGQLIDWVPLPYSQAIVVVASAMLGLAAGVGGVFVTLGQRSLVTDAITHATLPGVCVAFLVTGNKEGLGLAAGAAISGALAAGAIVVIERAGRTPPDAAVAVVLSGSFALGIVLLTAISGHPSSSQAGLERYLFGQAAGMTEGDARAFAALAIVVAVVITATLRPLRAVLFDSTYAATTGVPVRALEVVMTAVVVAVVVVGLRAVGAVLMVALVVAPAVAARQLSSRLVVMAPLAGLIGVLVGGAGALASVRSSTPTGPVIVLVAVAVVLAAVAIAPRRSAPWRRSRPPRGGTREVGL